MMKIVVENHIPYIQGLLEPYAQVAYLSQHEIDAQALADADVSPAFKEMPIDGVKIGRQMWMKSPDRKSNMLAQSLGQVCQELGIFLAANGVTTQADVDRIKALGFSYAQGPFIGPMVKPNELL